MTMQNRQWHLLAYDVRDEKRRQHLYRYISRRALMFQYSVYLLHQTPAELKITLKEVQMIINKVEDDLRLYPVTSPATIWVAGIQAQQLAGIYGSDKKTPGVLSRLLGMGK